MSRQTVDARSALASIAAMPKKLMPAMRVGAFNTVSDVKAQAIRNIKAKKITFDGQLQDNLLIDELANGYRLTVAMAYGAVLEYGRKAAWIPRAVIEDETTGLTRWVRVKMKPPFDEYRFFKGMAIGMLMKRKKKGGGKGKANRRSLEPLILWLKDHFRGDKLTAFHRSIAWAIARKKSKRPTPPRPFLAPAIEKVGTERHLLKNIVDAVNAALAS